MSIPDFPEPRSLPPGLSSSDRLEEIFQRIHDNVYSRSLLSTRMNPLADHISQMDTPLLPAPPPGLLEKITAIRSAQAPYYVVSGNFLARWIKRTHNLVLKLFGRKQAYFNTLTLDLLESMAAYLHAVQEHSKSQSSWIEALTRQVMLQTEQFAALQKDYQKLLLGNERIATAQGEGQEAKEQETQPASQPHEKQ